MRKISLLFLSIALFLSGCASDGEVVAQDLWVKSSEMSIKGNMTADHLAMTTA